MTKTLVLSYSRSGNTGRIGKVIAERLGCDYIRIRDKTSRSGFLGYLRSGREAMLKTLPQIKPLDANLSGYDLVIIGTPVWSFTMASPVRSFLRQYADTLGDVAFFATQGGKGAERAFCHMAALCQKRPRATLAVLEGDIKKKKYVQKVDTFVKSLER